MTKDRVQKAYDTMLSATALQACEKEYEAAKLELWHAVNKNSTLFGQLIHAIQDEAERTRITRITL